MLSFCAMYFYRVLHVVQCRRKWCRFPYVLKPTTVHRNTLHRDDAHEAHVEAHACFCHMHFNAHASMCACIYIYAHMHVCMFVCMHVFLRISALSRCMYVYSRVFTDASLHPFAAGHMMRRITKNVPHHCSVANNQNHHRWRF